MILTPEIEHILALIDRAIEQKYLRVEKIRTLARTEENYRTIIREVDRVKELVEGIRNRLRHACKVGACGA